MKHKPYTESQYKEARNWGLTNGYGGIKNGGGWIYGPDNKLVCQGWGQLWHKVKGRVRRKEK